MARPLIPDAVTVNHSGDDRLHSAHSHRPGIHHGSEVRVQTIVHVLILSRGFGYLKRQWQHFEVHRVY